MQHLVDNAIHFLEHSKRWCVIKSKTQNQIQGEVRQGRGGDAGAVHWHFMTSSLLVSALARKPSGQQRKHRAWVSKGLSTLPEWWPPHLAQLPWKTFPPFFSFVIRTPTGTYKLRCSFPSFLNTPHLHNFSNSSPIYLPQGRFCLITVSVLAQARCSGSFLAAPLTFTLWSIPEPRTLWQEIESA